LWTRKATPKPARNGCKQNNDSAEMINITPGKSSLAVKYQPEDIETVVVIST